MDFSKPAGVIRPLHGVNKGPIAWGGMIDLTEPLRALRIPSSRMHDCHWPNPDVVDIHAIFPNFDADPSQTSSYDFALTDEYLTATRATGAEIIFRLGESIEHTSVKRYVHPPKDYEKWAQICLGIIRHYNEGWANGTRHNIQYWEIWNEPENKPVMWSGSDEDYFRLYAVAARTIKKAYPNLKIGGPATGHTGEFAKGVFRPGSFVTNFLSYCRREGLPLDFFSWHCYTADPNEITGRARGIRKLLNDFGFTNTESHLNEWNFLPGNTWKPLSRSSAPEVRQRFSEEMAGLPGGAFLTTTLIELQDAPLDVSNLYHAEIGAFGLFNEFGVPQKNYYMLRAFAGLLETPIRASTRGVETGRLAVLAGSNMNQSSAAVLISNFSAASSRTRVSIDNLPWRGATEVATQRVNSRENLDRTTYETNKAGAITVILDLKAPSLALVRLRPARVK